MFAGKVCYNLIKITMSSGYSYPDPSCYRSGGVPPHF